MEIVQIVGIGFIATIMAILLKNNNPQFAFLIVVITGVTIFIFILTKISIVISVLERLAMEANINMVYLQTILKIIGIAYIAEFASQIMRDADQGAIASKIELAGKVLILVLAIPIISVIFETIIQFIPS
ncbi:MAG: stage III sporulation protein AD [Vulcanibacillus sp.]